MHAYSAGRLQLCPSILLSRNVTYSLCHASKFLQFCDVACFCVGTFPFLSFAQHANTNGRLLTYRYKLSYTMFGSYSLGQKFTGHVIATFFCLPDVPTVGHHSRTSCYQQVPTCRQSGTLFEAFGDCTFHKLLSLAVHRLGAEVSCPI